MSVQDRVPSTGSSEAQVATTPPAPAGREAREGGSAGPRVLAVLRIMVGLTFLWAFADKLLGLGYATGPAKAWINGGSPTKGFLSNVEVGPLQSILRSWAGAGWADWLFMIGLLGIGLALVLGIGMRVAAASGALLLTFMWIAEWPPAQVTSAGEPTSSTNPLIDSHLVDAVLLIALAIYAAGDTWGLGRRWASLDLVRRQPWLR